MVDTITNDTTRTRDVTGPDEAGALDAGGGGLGAADTAEVTAAVAAENPGTEAAALEGGGDGFERTSAPDGADVVARVDGLETDMRSGAWAASPEAAREAAGRIREVLRDVPEADRASVREELMRPVNDYARGGLTDPATGRIDPNRVETVGAFSDLLGQRGVDGLAQNLRTAAERGDTAGRDAIARTLNEVGRTNVDPNIQRGAARTLLNGPADVVRDGLAGRIDGLGPAELSHLSRTRGTRQTDARLRSLADGLDPSVNAALDETGLSQDRLAPGSTEGLHALLDGAGLVPGIGEFADAANGVLYATEGRFGDALISAGAMFGVGSLGTLGRMANRAPDGLGGAARRLGDRREDLAVEAMQRRGLDVQRANLDLGNTDIDAIMTTPQGRYAVLVGGDRKAMVGGRIDEDAVQHSLDRYRRAREAAIDPDGPFRADGAGAIMAFPRATTDPRVIDRFIQELGARNVLVY